MSFLSKIFKKKPPKALTINEFITDIETRLGRMDIGDKTINRMERKVEDLNYTLGELEEKIQEFSRDRKEMEEISRRVIELVSLIYTMDTKINNMNRDFEEIKKELAREGRMLKPKSKKKKELGQFELELGASANKENKENM
jgi:hypothetical protein